jgi:L-seryl-tRNA(Ser) seleniumtransferase
LANLPVSVVDSTSTVGGGSLPGQTLPTKALAISLPLVEMLTAQLRLANPPVVARIENNQLLLDPRTVLPEQDKALIATLTNILQTYKQSSFSG